MNKVSIVLPTYNGARYLHQSLTSCLEQTYTNLEVIVVDGGSTDSTRDILASINDPRLIVVDQPANSGRLPGALNLGFERATGQYLTWMQDDNVYLPEAIQTLAGYLDGHPEVNFVYSTHAFVDENLNPVKMYPFDQPATLRKRNCIGQFFLYRRNVYETVGKYDPDFFMAEDYDYWIRVSLQHRMQMIDCPHLYLYREHAASLTGRSYGRYLAMRVATRARRKWFHTGLLEFRRDMAQSYIEEAFASLKNNDQPRLRACILQGLRYNPAWIFNRGVASIFIKKVLGLDRSRPASK